MSRSERFFNFHMNLAFKLSLVMILLTLVAYVGLGWFFIERESTLLRNQQEAHGRSLVLTFSQLIESTVDLSDRTLVQQVANTMLEDPDVVECSITDSSGNKLAYAIKSETLPPLSGVQKISQPIKSGEGPGAGTLEIRLSLRRVKEQIDTLKKEMLPIASGVIGAVILLILASIRILLPPVGKLIATMERAARGELSSNVDIQSRDEFGELAKAFNRVIFHFQAAIEEFEKKLEMRTRQLEEHVDELNQTKTLVQRLENDLESSGRELEMVNRKLKETDLTKLIFIGIASHELKTPLTAIKANIDFILSEKEGKLPEHLKSYLLTIQRNTNRIKMRMDHMLDLTRIRSGRLHLYREPIHLSQVVGGYVNEVKPENKRLLFKVEVPDHLVVYADRNGFHDIFVNLLFNAVKFTPDGGEIRVVATPKNDFVLHEIQDTGIGIPQDKLDKVFDEFYQVESGKHGGTGLGLAITKRLVEEHGGRIWIESKVGKGSSFFFTVPAFAESRNGRPIQT